MSIPFILWLVLSLFLIGFWVWTSVILFKQKRSWKRYAAKKKLRYLPNKFYDTPDIGGAIDGYKVRVFSTTHPSRNARGERRLTTIEVSLLTHLPVDGAVASGGMVDIVEDLNLSKAFRPDANGWDDSYVVRSKDNNVMRAYLTGDRLRALIDLMKIKNAWIILIFAINEGLLRIDTPDPLEDIEKLDKIVTQMVEAAKILDLAKGEGSRLEQQKKPDDTGGVLELDHDALDKAGGLELEDDDASGITEKEKPD